MAVKVRIKKGDKVFVLSGEDAKRTGKVLEVRPDENRLVVEDINIVHQHTKPDKTNSQGGIISRPGPMHVSKVALVCPNCDKPSRFKIERKVGKDGKKEAVRICRRCGKSID
jgi:large subunit ribosomal protein L24